MIGIVIVDHGSRQEVSNQGFLEVVRRFAARETFPIVEPAHMELGSPTIAEAIDQAVMRGAKQIIIQPYFLLPGKHWHNDIPRLCQEAMRKHPGLPWAITPPLGQSEKMLDVIQERIEQTLNQSSVRPHTGL
jgi:sirohydrochlorin ferrochelatase